MPKKVLFINQEAEPYVEDTLMARVGQEWPERLQRLGCEIRTFMPKWGTINERRGQLHEVIRLSGMNLVVDDNDHPLLIKVASMPGSRIQVYFIDNEEYFAHRLRTTDAEGLPYKDNGERAIFFTKGVLETVKKLRWTPDVIVCQGWMAALVPLYVKTAYRDEPWLGEAHVVTTLFGEGFVGALDGHFRQAIEFREANAEVLAPYKEVVDYDELCRIARDFSDDVVEIPDEKDAKEAFRQVTEIINKR